MLAQRAQRQVRSEVQALLTHAMMNALKREVTEEEWLNFIEDITTRTRDPYSVAIELQEKIGLKT